MTDRENELIDKPETNEEKEPSALLLPAPYIKGPPLSSKIRPGFQILAVAAIENPLSWRLEIFWPGGERKITFGPQPDRRILRYTVPIWTIPPGSFWFQIDYEGDIFWSNWAQSGDCEMLKLYTPVINEPTQGTTHLANVRISGTGTTGAYVNMTDVNGGFLKQSSIIDASERWEINYPWTPGKKDIRAIQISPGPQTSEHSGVRSFAIKPPKPAITQPSTPIQGRQALEITGVHNGAVTLVMFKHNVGRIPGTFSGTGTTRSFTPTANWAPGRITVDMQQTVDTVVSDSSDVRTFSVKPPKPAITQPSTAIQGRQPLQITGVHNGAVTLTMFEYEVGRIAGTFSGTGTTRTFTPTANWVPGRITVNMEQVVDTVVSDASDVRTLSVKPPKPAITQPSTAIQGRQPLEITGVHAGTVTLKMFKQGGAEVAGTFSGTGTTRSFTPTDNWAPGRITVNVQQTVDTVVSDASDVRTLSVKPAKPAITQPSTSIQGKQALEITGVHNGAVTLVMFKQGGAEVAGTFSGTGTTRTFTPTDNWAPGVSSVYAVQTFDFVESDPGDTRTFTVKPPKPAITSPPNPAQGKQALEITDVYNGAVTLLMFEYNVGGIAGTFSGTGATRTFTPTDNWAPGVRRVYAVQTVDFVESDPGDTRTFSVKPPKPAITQPPSPTPANQVLTVIGVHAGSVILKMFKQGDAEVAGTFSGTEATRNFTPTNPWTTGSSTVFAKQTVSDVESDPSDPITFTVKVEELPDPPQIKQPEAYQQTPTRPILEVIGLPGALITVRRDEDEVLCAEHADPDGVMHYRLTKSLVPGDHSIDAKQKSSGLESAWSDPHPFTVKDLPKNPTIDFPRHGSTAHRKLNIRGAGETRGQILIRHEKDDEGDAFAEIKGARSWRWDAQEPWPLGHYTIMARQEEDGDSSSWTEAHPFEVIETRYAVGDAQQVPGQPVDGAQNVLLRVQVVVGDTAEAAAGVTVEWRISGQSQAIASSETDPDGWTEYLFIPDTEGELEVLADFTKDNGDVVMVQYFIVKALLIDGQIRVN